MSIGKRVYGLGAIMLGIPGLIYGSFAAMGLPVPLYVPGYQILAYASAALLILAGLAINVRRLTAIASLALAAFFALWVMMLHLPHAFANFAIWVSWEAVAETMVMALGGMLAFTWAPGAGEARAASIVRIARPMFGVGLIVFGTSEFVYAAYTGAMVPAWLPPSQLFWAYLTGAAQIAAGLAILSGVQARLAAILLTAMYLVFGLLVHLPRLIADPSDAGRWAENGVNLILAGAAWVLADTLVRAKLASRQRAPVSASAPPAP
ncbi:MAG TPA: DoxX family protein [Allosphingosinicella sp.]|jgi:uncharacterized membrane protein YphA (DoxX/SURF4 family)|nr:DoxX family protein [Allosphingosinicella sp.]